MSRALSLAGFQVTFIGRFWVITEVCVYITDVSNREIDIYERSGKSEGFRRKVVFDKAAD